MLSSEKLSAIKKHLFLAQKRFRIIQFFLFTFQTGIFVHHCSDFQVNLLLVRDHHLQVDCRHQGRTFLSRHKVLNSKQDQDFKTFYTRSGLNRINILKLHSKQDLVETGFKIVILDGVDGQYLNNRPHKVGV